MKKKRRTRYNNRGAAVVLAGLALIGAIALALFLTRGDKVKNTYYAELPRAHAGLMDENGVKHSLEADFTLELSGRLLSRKEKQDVSGSISAAMSAMNYETISGEEGIAYLKSELTTLLNERYGDGVVKEIYLTEYAGDFNLPVKDITPAESHRETMESLLDKLRR